MQRSLHLPSPPSTLCPEEPSLATKVMVSPPVVDCDSPISGCGGTYYVPLEKKVAAEEEQYIPDSQVMECVHGMEKHTICQTRKDANKSPTEQNELHRYKRRVEIFDCVSLAQKLHLRGESRKKVFQCLLDGLLDIMNAQYG